MRKITHLLNGVVVAAFTQSFPVAVAAVFTNGSFELPGGLASNSTLEMNPGETRLTGWTIEGTGGHVTLINGQQPPYLDFAAAAGEYQLTFNGGDGAPGTWISQTFDTLTNEDYVVTFQVGRLGTQPGSVSIKASARTQAGE